MQLREYVEGVCDPTSSTFVPATQRVAVMDMDGTLVSETLPYMAICVFWVWRALEDPDYEATEREQAVAQSLKDCMERHDLSSLEYSEREVAEWMDRSMAGLTETEAIEKAQHWLESTPAASPYEHLRMSETYYQPMLEVVDYLRSYGFVIYVVSGSDREFCRAFLSHRLGLSIEQILGYTVRYEKSAKGEVRTAEVLTVNDGIEKVKNIGAKIAHRPLLAFGNSTGDYAMMHDVVAGGGRSFCILNDDTERDYGNPARAARHKARCQAAGVETISIKEDWVKVYN